MCWQRTSAGSPAHRPAALHQCRKTRLGRGRSRANPCRGHEGKQAGEPVGRGLRTPLLRHTNKGLGSTPPATARYGRDPRGQTRLVRRGSKPSLALLPASPAPPGSAPQAAVAGIRTRTHVHGHRAGSNEKEAGVGIGAMSSPPIGLGIGVTPKRIARQYTPSHAIRNVSLKSVWSLRQERALSTMLSGADADAAAPGRHAAQRLRS